MRPDTQEPSRVITAAKRVIVAAKRPQPPARPARPRGDRLSSAKSLDLFVVSLRNGTFFFLLPSSGRCRSRNHAGKQRRSQPPQDGDLSLDQGGRLPCKQALQLSVVREIDQTDDGPPRSDYQHDFVPRNLGFDLRATMTTPFTGLFIDASCNSRFSHG